MAGIDGGSRQNAVEPRLNDSSYAFVSETGAAGSRSHAMRQHWRRRRQQGDRKSKSWKSRAVLRPILPTGSSSDLPCVLSESDTTPWPNLHSGAGPKPSSQREHLHSPSVSRSPENPQGQGGIPAQILNGLNLALGSVRLDPFDQFPVRLTSQHHKLLHHWLSVYAAMMFDDSGASTFNPMRDVWFPLDLSNAASFNAVMAHSAAHLARMQGREISAEALNFKAEAVRIVSAWTNDPNLALSDDNASAILRLLTYERYWGTEEEWRVHHAGLKRLVQSRGGMQSLRDNWRLELAILLVMLMSKPTWFDIDNQIWEISNPSITSDLVSSLGSETNLHKLRCLWLLSFVQDLGTFVATSPERYKHGLSKYPFIQKAILLMQRETGYGHSSSSSCVPEDCPATEHQHLSCLMLICIASHKRTAGHLPWSEQPISDVPDPTNTWHGEFDALAAIDQYLGDCFPHWADSMSSLSEWLLGANEGRGRFAEQARYALNMTEVLASLSLEARRGVGRCLLRILCCAVSDKAESTNFSWMPDMLLSSLRGF